MTTSHLHEHTARLALALTFACLAAFAPAQGNQRDAMLIGLAAGQPALPQTTLLGAGMTLSVHLHSPGGSLHGQPFLTAIDLIPPGGAPILTLPGEPGVLAVSPALLVLVDGFGGTGIIPFAGGLPPAGFGLGFTLPYIRTPGDLVFQSAVLDPGAPNGLAITNAVGGRFPSPPAIYQISVNNSVLAQFGYEVAVADVDGNGLDQLLIGSREHSIPGFPDIGAVFIYGGIPPVLQQVILDPAPEAFSDFGVSVACGDLDNDGFPDLAIGARHSNSLGLADSGRVVVFYGPAFTTSTTILPPAAIPGGRFGHQVAIGDFNGDGIDDLAVSSTGHASAGVVQSGLVDVFHGPGLAFGLAVPNPVPGVGDKFGYRLGTADFDGDGFGDLAVAAPFKSLAQAGGDWSGALYVLKGPSFQQYTYFPNPAPSVQGLLGADMRLVDMDLDGHLDLVAGAELDTYGGINLAGSVYILYGPGFSNSLQVLPPIPVADGGFGAGCDAGDFNGDGIPDLMVGEFWWSPPYRSGQAHVLLGPAYTTAISILEPAPATSNQFGRRIRAADLNGDGRHEMVVGVPLSSPGGISRAGAVYVVQH